MRKFDKKPKVKSSRIYFQVGLIIALASVLFFIEHSTKNVAYKINNLDHDTFKIEETYHKKIIVEKERKVPEKQPKANKPKELTLKFKKVDNVTEIFEPSDSFNEDLDVGSLENPEDGDIEVPAIIRDDSPRNLNTVSEVPVFPGCEKYATKQERIECFSDHVAKLVRRKFDGGLGAELDLQGEQRIYVQFTVNKNGDIIDVKANSKSKELKKEAERVAGLLPSMIPGKQNGQPVNVIYSLPIILKL